MICIHHNDLDGKCSAAIVKRAHKDVPIKFIEIDYKDPCPFERCLNETVVIVDFSFKPDDMAKIINFSSHVTWIDHHATAKDYSYQNLPGLRNFKDKEEAGCELTWRFYFSSEPVPMAVSLLGDYDKWSLSMRDSKVFYEGMKLQKTDPDSDIWDSLLSNYTALTSEIIHDGLTATLYRDNYCANVRKAFGYETTIDGNKAYATNIYMFGSGGFGEKFYQYPLCIAYIHDGNKFTVSLYSERVDVSAIAKNHGGGGHKGAAGFVCNTLPFTKAGGL
jgi:uncharacterized protein